MPISNRVLSAPDTPRVVAEAARIMAQQRPGLFEQIREAHSRLIQIARGRVRPNEGEVGRIITFLQERFRNEGLTLDLLELETDPDVPPTPPYLKSVTVTEPGASVCAVTDLPFRGDTPLNIKDEPYNAAGTLCSQLFQQGEQFMQEPALIGHEGEFRRGVNSNLFLLAQMEPNEAMPHDCNLVYAFQTTRERKVRCLAYPVSDEIAPRRVV